MVGWESNVLLPVNVTCLACAAATVGEVTFPRGVVDGRVAEGGAGLTGGSREELDTNSSGGPVEWFGKLSYTNTTGLGYSEQAD